MTKNRAVNGAPAGEVTPKNAMIAMITGATAGLGLGLARRLISQGARVVGVGRRWERLAALRAELGERFLPLPLDVCDRTAVEAALKSLPPDFVEIDVLVNNAGLALGMEPAQRSSLDEWQRIVETNINGVLYLTRTLLPDLLARGRGHIVNLGSVAGTYPYPGGNVYGASKAFLAQFSRNLRADLLGTPIRVTTIEPGLVGGTEFSEVRFRGDQARAAAVYAGADALTPDDVVEAIVWVLDRPPHVNINELSLMPVCQAFGPLAVTRTAGAAAPSIVLSTPHAEGVTVTSNQAQIEFWNGARGASWVADQEHRDRAMAPYGAAVLERAQPARGERVIDVGCGCGATVLALAAAVGGQGEVLGVDVSEPMLARARARAADLPQARIVCADASSFVFERTAKLVFSRFGVMFFAEPVLAFANLRRALVPGGRLVFVCWRGVADNQWMSVPYLATLSALAAPPVLPPPDAPGPLAFADPVRVQKILESAGFHGVTLTAFDHAMPLGDDQGLEAAAAEAITLGPAARLLMEADEPTRARALAAVREALRPHLDGQRVRLPAGAWLVTAQSA